MRYDVLKDGPAPYLHITLDGVRVMYVYAFDTEEGWVEHKKHDADGNIIIEGEGDDRDAVNERLLGKVEVRGKYIIYRRAIEDRVFKGWKTYVPSDKLTFEVDPGCSMNATEIIRFLTMLGHDVKPYA